MESIDFNIFYRTWIIYSAGIIFLQAKEDADFVHFTITLPVLWYAQLLEFYAIVFQRPIGHDRIISQLWPRCQCGCTDWMEQPVETRLGWGAGANYMSQPRARGRMRFILNWINGFLTYDGENSEILHAGHTGYAMEHETLEIIADDGRYVRDCLPQEFFDAYDANYA